jgi:hypothetical protein
MSKRKRIHDELVPVPPSEITASPPAKPRHQIVKLYNLKPSHADDLQNMAAAAAPNITNVETYCNSAKRACTKIADPPRAPSGMPATYPNCNWYVQLRFLCSCRSFIFHEKNYKFDARLDVP